ncbi:MAG: thioesterase family protein [Bacteroidales bacterium]|nr:thioesterase family protein [Bacteroides sp.]MCM1197965.1 thioesterase family protein [Clostridium sp.]MCM1502720.1 thioesterase family protein [Bacteroidales bacterium]
MLKTGLKNSIDQVVTEELTASHIGSGTVKVFSTPMMIALMERTCRTCVKPYLEDGQETVGTHVNVSHISSTPVGMTVRAECELIDIDRRKLTFKVAAYNEKGLIGEGLHERFIIDVDRFQSKL